MKASSVPARRAAPISVNERAAAPAPDAALTALAAEIKACRLCAGAFAATPSAHVPRPVLTPSATARICVAGQAPGIRAHRAGRPFDDPSGQRLRRWLGVDEATFWDPRRFAILPMGFCFPGQNAKGADLPPPRICAETWRARLMALHPRLELIVLLGRAAQAWHLGAAAARRPVAELTGEWRAALEAPERPRFFAAPHPSWRNNAWLKRHPWFEAEAVPALQARVADLLDG